MSHECDQPWRILRTIENLIPTLLDRLEDLFVLPTDEKQLSPHLFPRQSKYTNDRSQNPPSAGFVVDVIRPASALTVVDPFR
jgi:hypothetical protein